MHQWLTRVRAGFFLSVTAISFLVMVVRGILLPSDEVRNFQNDSDIMVTRSVTESLTRGISYLDGFMGVYGPSGHRRVIALVDPERAAHDPDVPYISNTGLQYRAIAAFAPQDPAELPAYFTKIQIGLLLAWAILLGAIAVRLRIDFGLFASLVAVVMLTLSDQPFLFAKSLYWTGFLLFLPFVILFVFYGAMRSRASKMALLGVFGAALFVKFLCGYEYITCIAGSAAAAIAYHELRRFSPRRTILGWVMAAGLVAALAFGAALTVHYFQNLHYFKTPALALKGLTLPPRYNSISGEGIRVYPVTPHTVAKQIYLLLVTPVVDDLSMLEILLLPAIGLLLLVRTRPRRALAPGETAAWAHSVYCLAVAAGIGAAASASWILALHHFVEHPHLGTIILFLPTLPLLYALIGALWAWRLGAPMPASLERPAT